MPGAIPVRAAGASSAAWVLARDGSRARQRAGRQTVQKARMATSTGGGEGRTTPQHWPAGELIWHQDWRTPSRPHNRAQEDEPLSSDDEGHDAPTLGGAGRAAAARPALRGHTASRLIAKRASGATTAQVGRGWRLLMQPECSAAGTACGACDGRALTGAQLEAVASRRGRHDDGRTRQQGNCGAGALCCAALRLAHPQTAGPRCFPRRRTHMLDPLAGPSPLGAEHEEHCGGGQQRRVPRRADSGGLRLAVQQWPCTTRRAGVPAAKLGGRPLS